MKNAVRNHMNRSALYIAAAWVSATNIRGFVWKDLRENSEERAGLQGPHIQHTLFSYENRHCSCSTRSYLGKEIAHQSEMSVTCLI